MKRRFQGLASTAHDDAEVPDGVFLVRVDHARYSNERQKPCYRLRFLVLEPEVLAGCSFSSRICCTPRALWRLAWFLRDFGYDPELLARDEVEEKHVIGLRGVVKISHLVVDGRSLTNLDAFASADAWESISSAARAPLRPEVAS